MRGVGNLGHKPAAIYEWSASKVVNFILQSSDLSLKFFTQKALFLVLVACGRRINDTLASVRTPHFLKFSIDKQTLIINYVPGYIFKNDKNSERPTPITWVRYSEIVRRKGADGDIRNVNDKLCPVKAIEQYLQATKDSKCSFLFVNPYNVNNVLY